MTTLTTMIVAHHAERLEELWQLQAADYRMGPLSESALNRQHEQAAIHTAFPFPRGIYPYSTLVSGIDDAWQDQTCTRCRKHVQECYCGWEA